MPSENCEITNYDYSATVTCCIVHGKMTVTVSVCHFSNLFPRIKIINQPANANHIVWQKAACNIFSSFLNSSLEFHSVILPTYLFSHRMHIGLTVSSTALFYSYRITAAVAWHN